MFSYKHENARGNLWKLEVFYKKTSPVTPYFYFINLFLGNIGEKMKKILGKEVKLSLLFSIQLY